ncbi:MAG: hypothetical protein ACI915_005483 [Gammaproteobacteria bacterium]|jgi:hypothetical protein
MHRRPSARMWFRFDPAQFRPTPSDLGFAYRSGGLFHRNGLAEHGSTTDTKAVDELFVRQYHPTHDGANALLIFDSGSPKTPRGNVNA